MNCSTSVPAVSIILPTLNARKFLEARISSILNQTFRDWELIVVDSYSDDGTWEYLNQLQTHDEQEIFRYQIPRGLYQAWNFGISKARGTYVYIATADDTMKSDCLEKWCTHLRLIRSAASAIPCSSSWIPTETKSTSFPIFCRPLLAF